jgi:hypothetical protein
VNVTLGDEFLVIVKYILKEKSYNILRIQLNTNFIYKSFTRVYEQDIDASNFAHMDADNIMHIDFMFEEILDHSKLALLRVTDIGNR